MDKRNNAIHGNCDPEREKNESIYFWGQAVREPSADTSQNPGYRAQVQRGPPRSWEAPFCARAGLCPHPINNLFNRGHARSGSLSAIWFRSAGRAQTAAFSL